MLSFHSWVFACYINEIIPYISFCIWLLYSMSCLLDPSKARVGKLWPCHLFLKTQFHRNIAMPTCWHDFPGSSGGNESVSNVGDLDIIPWRREWLRIPVFLPGEFHGQRSLAGYSSWGHKELDTTEWLTLKLNLT